MGAPGRAGGVRALLFERLAARAPVFCYDDERTVEDSIRDELDCLFNSRVGVDVERLEGRGRRTTIDYGIPDLSLFPPGDDQALRRLTRHMEAAIAAYEPRLGEARVTVLRPPGRPDSLGARIDGVLTVLPGRRPVTFSISLRQDRDGV